jgi:membrane-bound inhibitor of C-type lysozyme
VTVVIRRITALALIGFVASATAPSAQTYLQYRCDDGAQFEVAFVEKTRAAYIQLDGKPMTLPLRLSASGSRYKKSGVTFWIKGNDAQLKRPKHKWTQCRTG